MGAVTRAARGSRPDLLASAIFIGLGALVLWSSKDLPFGSAAMMGPGYLPVLVGARLRQQIASGNRVWHSNRSRRPSSAGYV